MLLARGIWGRWCVRRSWPAGSTLKQIQGRDGVMWPLISEDIPYPSKTQLSHALHFYIFNLFGYIFTPSLSLPPFITTHTASTTKTNPIYGVWLLDCVGRFLIRGATFVKVRLQIRKTNISLVFAIKMIQRNLFLSHRWVTAKPKGGAMQQRFRATLHFDVDVLRRRSTWTTCCICFARCCPNSF